MYLFDSLSPSPVMPLVSATIFIKGEPTSPELEALQLGFNIWTGLPLQDSAISSQ